MLKKRLVGVITVKDGWAVQSFGYRRYLPLGRPEILVENLDRWGVDEILVLCIDRSREGRPPDLELLRRISQLGVSTPLTFGGGVRRREDAVAVIQAGAERICLDTALRGDHRHIREMAAVVGAQALVASLPLSIGADGLLWYDYAQQRSGRLIDADFSLFADGVISEALIIDWMHEGQRGAFDPALVEAFPFDGVPLIAFGGLSESEQLAAVLAMPRVVAVAVGNFLSYREHAVQALKRQLTALPLRFARTYLTNGESVD